MPLDIVAAAAEILTRVDEDQIPDVRLLRAMLDHAPTDDAKHEVAHEIVQCEGSEMLAALAKYFLEGFILPMNVLGSKMPDFMGNSSKYHAILKEDINAELKERAKHDVGAWKALVLRRDGFRCVATGSYDMAATISMPETIIPAMIQDAGSRCFTQAAHIIPSSINKASTTTPDSNGGAIRKIFKTFGNISIADELDGEDINRLENVITLRREVHIAFGRLKIYFERVDGDTYRYRKINPEISVGPSDGAIIEFTSIDQLPLPDPRYLALHAACAKVAHDSGVAELIDEYMYDMEEGTVLATDGSSAQLLDHALSLAVALDDGQMQRFDNVDHASQQSERQAVHG